ncbi:hypothetical protein E4O05_10570 [Treponema sp. OMZ 787]|nr:hypothetical protein [Treponema sp. OMZ 787]UTC61232.1 hypothetical protein E4O05_10570 [Treponema sp. OMZ 787]
MFFADYETHKKEKISQSILWEYDTKAPDWERKIFYAAKEHCRENCI